MSWPVKAFVQEGDGLARFATSRLGTGQLGSAHDWKMAANLSSNGHRQPQNRPLWSVSI